MAESQGSANGKGKKRPALDTYFFLNDELHRRLHINRGADKVSAWNYPQGKRMKYDYSTVLRRHKRAFRSREVQQLVNRKRMAIESAMRDGMIERPQHTYGLDENRNFKQYMWREEDIMALHEYFASIHYGRPRKDGEVTPYTLPSARELRAMINNENILYVKQGDTFIPSWRAKEF